MLNFKLALRMLVKYPLLTIVGGAGMAFGLAAGVAGFEIRTKMTNPMSCSLACSTALRLRSRPD